MLIHYKTWIYQCLIKLLKSPSTWSRVPNSVRIRHSGRAVNRGVNGWGEGIALPLIGPNWLPYKHLDFGGSSG